MECWSSFKQIIYFSTPDTPFSIRILDKCYDLLTITSMIISDLHEKKVQDNFSLSPLFIIINTNPGLSYAKL